MLKAFGRYLDGHNKKKTFIRFSLFIAIENILKFLSFNQIMLFVADLYGRMIKGVYALTYETYSYVWFDHDHQEKLVDERVVIRESGFHFFAGICLFSLSFLYRYFSLNEMFLVIGVVYVLFYLVGALRG